jgi:phosphate transport system substrate-binding protein
MARWSRFARQSGAVATVGLLFVLMLTACGGGSATATTAPAATATKAAAASPATGATTAPTTGAAASSSAPTAATAAATAAPSGTTAASAAVSGTTPAATGGQPKGPASCTDGSIIALGSTAIQPLAEAAAKAYTTKCPNGKINVQGGGSGTGLTQVSGGGATIGDSDIFAEEGSGIDAKALVDHQVAVQGFAMAANPSVKVDTLTKDQVVAIFTGKTTNWKDVGGPDQKIVVINRPASSGTRATFKKYALGGQSEAQGVALTEDSSGAVSKAINDTPGAIGYLGLAYFLTNKDLKIIKFNGKDPSVANISDDSYPIWSYAHMYTKGEATGLAKAFLDYMVSDDIQTTLIPQLGYIPANQVKAKHTPA